MYGRTDRPQCSEWNLSASNILSTLAAAVALSPENTGRGRVVVYFGV